jgi:hypothetical protein
MSEPGCHHDRGVTSLELLVAVAAVLTGLALGAGLIRQAAEAWRWQPEAADQVQRLRVGVETLSSALAGAGAGLPGVDDDSGAFVPMVFPHLRGVTGADPPLSVFADRFTVVSASADNEAQGRLVGAAQGLDPLRFDPGFCAPLAPACGFQIGQQVIVASRLVAADVVAISNVGPGLLDHDAAALTERYESADDVRMAAVEVRGYYVDAARRQLRLSTAGTDMPVLDGVDGLEIRLLGEPRAPARPRPPPGRANCVVGADGSPRLSDLAPDYGPFVRLDAARLSDGPVCGAGAWRFDADLYRVRLVRLTLRMAAPRAVRPAAGRPSTLGVTIDVSVRVGGRAG